ncbi:phage head morphogenesis protein [Xenorhabdus griffiniae]|uniref:Phage head morphogenesis protein n=1 Tax=Xenorhabdus griffiniae TaxID=351672 RepID=A0ABY9XMD3_9GAMM|nr:phage head morphogenesis protein [Xenorhabdus griffiniae]MBD1228326.1 phage head morphogenesis protein [Xenorhabdus griffiniae]MBE8587763.1 phage head morphogenesis protein [Xenorhabdus griffiniae]WMV74036.1 phage head morphogenesis protein [Xenorhabdus griffiniae]WNH03716.1 phage head morphogenesis protein [Xenorhabdus griffiniae]
MTQARIGTPIIPRNKSDPTQSYRAVNKMFRDIERRYYDIKTALRQLFDQRLKGRTIESNAKLSYVMHGNTLYHVNTGAYVYDMTSTQLADLLEILQIILDDYLLDGGKDQLWAFSYVADEYKRGTHSAYTNLSAQSTVYAQQTTLSVLLSTPAYQNQIATAFVEAYSDWKGISDAARADLSNVITDAIARGVSPRETAAIVSKRLDVSMGLAKNIAQTEQVGALRRANWNEADWAQERLGLNIQLLWLSALKPTTRWWHAVRHGKTYTKQEVEGFYSKKGNRYRCFCAQQPVVLDDDGKLYNKGLTERLTEESKAWESESSK